MSKACYLGHNKVVEYLLSKSEIIIDLIDSKGRTALHNAAWGIEGGKDGKKRGNVKLPDSPESVLLLLKKGHKVDIQDFDGNTALISAASSAGV